MYIGCPYYARGWHMYIGYPYARRWHMYIGCPYARGWHMYIGCPVYRVNINYKCVLINK